MSRRDEFDDPKMSDAINAIFTSLDKKDKVRPRRPLRSMLVIAALAAFLGGVIWYSYPREAAHQELMSVPIIRADIGPFKAAPADPGGMDIPHRESTVFDALRARRAEGDTARVENLLSDVEEPLDRDKLFAGLRTELTIEGRTVHRSAVKEPVSDSASPAAEPVSGADDAPEQDIAAAGQETQLAAQAEDSVPVPAARPGQDVAARQANDITPAAGLEQSARSGTHYVQLASLTSREAAEKAWEGFRREHDVLSALSLRVQAADIAGRGTYYRVQGGPVAESEARRICAAIQSKKPGGCLVINP